jgi:hypothetical protein
MRRCAAPGCRRRFSPHISKQGRQRYCSNTCRQRAFYWTFKDRRGMRYAEAQDQRQRRRKAARRRPRPTGKVSSRPASRRR